MASLRRYDSAGRGPPIGHASSARRTCCASLSASEYTAMVWIPSRRQVRITRQAISPRLAISTRSNMRVPYRFAEAAKLVKLAELLDLADARRSMCLVSRRRYRLADQALATQS